MHKVITLLGLSLHNGTSIAQIKVVNLLEYCEIISPNLISFRCDSLHPAGWIPTLLG